ncbi:MAG TPA: hypothetical protein VFQ60_00905 [Patescibacteria group bacterium]|nr:hypothetical protein [Patescibacteria group bacterium]
MSPSARSLENPFDPKERDPDNAAFVENVLGSKKKGKRELKRKIVEGFGTEVDLHFSAEDRKRIEDEGIFGEIISRERQALRNFFGKEISVPAIPKQATKERILEWRALGFELHYLPPISMAEIKRGEKGEITEVTPIEFPGWKKKPGKRYASGLSCIDFFDDIKAGKLSPLAINLPGAWILIDAREKPSGLGEYPDDALAPALKELRKDGIVNDRNTKKESRFDLSPRELENPKVLEAFAKVLDFQTVSGLTVAIPRAMEANILGNIHYPQWDKSKDLEWFSDLYEKDGFRSCLYGGLSYISLISPRKRLLNVGFRLIGRFSQ